MKIMIECFKYQYKQYLLSAKFIIPTIVYVSFLGFMYSMMPVEIVSNFAVTGIFLFLFMVWLSASCLELEPEVSEQIIVLRIQSARKYYYARILFLMILCLAIAVISLFYPVISHYLHDQKLFTRNIVFMDIVGGFFLMFFCSFLGSVVGNFFSPHIIPNAKARMILTVLCATLAVTRIGIVEEIPLTKGVLWIIPPVSDLMAWFTKEMFFQPDRLLLACMILLLYGIVLAVMEAELSSRRRFS